MHFLTMLGVCSNGMQLVYLVPKVHLVFTHAIQMLTVTKS